jgi:hypothetical protein
MSPKINDNPKKINAFTHTQVIQTSNDIYSLPLINLFKIPKKLPVFLVAIPWPSKDIDRCFYEIQYPLIMFLN